MSKTKSSYIEYTTHALDRWNSRVGLDEESFRAKLNVLVKKRPSTNSPLRKSNKGKYSSTKFYTYKHVDSKGRSRLVSIAIENKNGKATAVSVFT